MQATWNWTSSPGDTFARFSCTKKYKRLAAFLSFLLPKNSTSDLLEYNPSHFPPRNAWYSGYKYQILITYLPVLFWSYNHRFLQVYDLSENVERLSLVRGIHRGWSWTLLLVDHADTSSRMDCAWQVPFFLHHFIDCCIGYVLEKTARGVALRSFSITRNSQGPSLVPCGTPGRTERHSEKQSFPSFWLFAACWRQRQQANLWFKD